MSDYLVVFVLAPIVFACGYWVGANWSTKAILGHIEWNRRRAHLNELLDAYTRRP